MPNAMGDGGGGHCLVRMEWHPAGYWMVGVSASVNLPLHHKVQKISSGTNSPGWSRKKGRKRLCVCGVVVCVRLSLCTILIQNTAQNSSDNLRSYPLYNRHCSDIYCRGERTSDSNNMGVIRHTF